MQTKPKFLSLDGRGQGEGENMWLKVGMFITSPPHLNPLPRWGEEISDNGFPYGLIWKIY
jgi:hypothetical protein